MYTVIRSFVIPVIILPPQITRETCTRKYIWILMVKIISKIVLLSCVATSVLRMRLLHAVAFSKKLRWLTQTFLKTKLHSLNACVKRSSQRSLSITAKHVCMIGVACLSAECIYVKTNLFRHVYNLCSFVILVNVIRSH